MPRRLPRALLAPALGYGSIPLLWSRPAPSAVYLRPLSPGTTAQAPECPRRTCCGMSPGAPAAARRPRRPGAARDARHGSVSHPGESRLITQTPHPGYRDCRRSCTSPHASDVFFHLIRPTSPVSPMRTCGSQGSRCSPSFNQVRNGRAKSAIHRVLRPASKCLNPVLSKGGRLPEPSQASRWLFISLSTKRK